MKKFISLLCLALAACSSNKTPSSPEEITYISESSELQHISNDIVYIRFIYLVIPKITSFQGLK